MQRKCQIKGGKRNPKKGRKVLCQGKQVRYAFMQENSKQFSILAMCEVMRVSKAGYYDWLERPVSNREKANNTLLEKIKETHEFSRKNFGYRRIYQQLLQEGVNCSENRVLRLMRKAGLRAKTKRKFKATTNSKHSFPVASNLLDRKFTVSKPNTAWVGDITYIQTAEGWLYLATVIDLFSRNIIGWAMDKRMTANLVKDALQMAIWKRKPVRSSSLMFHSDRGSQYAGHDYQKMLKEHKIKCSMSRKGNCWDNAVAESFFKTLKTELVYHESYRTREEAKQNIFEYIEIFYNRVRLHSSLGYKSPQQFEMAA